MIHLDMHIIPHFSRGRNGRFLQFCPLFLVDSASYPRIRMVLPSISMAAL